jgi:hypothetical protein
VASASFGQCCRIRTVIKLSADAPHAIGLLRARRQRPRRCRAAEDRDELAPVLTELHAIPHDERGPHRRISNWRRSVSGYSSQPRRISAKSRR